MVYRSRWLYFLLFQAHTAQADNTHTLVGLKYNRKYSYLYYSYIFRQLSLLYCYVPDHSQDFRSQSDAQKEDGLGLTTPAPSNIIEAGQKPISGVC